MSDKNESNRCQIGVFAYKELKIWQVRGANVLIRIFSQKSIIGCSNKLRGFRKKFDRLIKVPLSVSYLRVLGFVKFSKQCNARIGIQISNKR